MSSLPLFFYFQFIALEEDWLSIDDGGLVIDFIKVLVGCFVCFGFAAEDGFFIFLEIGCSLDQPMLLLGVGWEWEFEPEALHDFVFFFLIFEEVLSECGFGLFVHLFSFMEELYMPKMKLQ